MIAPEGSPLRCGAHGALYTSAVKAKRRGLEYWQWLEGGAPLWAVEAASARELAAVIAFVFGVESHRVSADHGAAERKGAA